MRLYDLHFFPHPPLYLLALLLLFGLAVVFLRYYLIGHAYERLGLSRGLPSSSCSPPSWAVASTSLCCGYRRSGWSNRESWSSSVCST